ncbi:killer suppression protein [bacterium]|nr:killer suppression protein [bacterium]
MDIYFKSKKMQRICSDSREMQKAYGVEMVKKLQQRLMELKAATNLAEISPLPPARIHPYQGHRAGQFSVDLVHPYRLIFVPGENPVPRKKDGGIDLTGITSIEVLEIYDPHKKGAK